MIEALFAAMLVAATSLIGVVFFGNSGRLQGAQKFVVPMAVGIFLSLVLYELIPKTLSASPQWGGLVVGLGFVGFYVLANYLHQRYHHLESEDCDRKGAAILLMIGDGVHNVADGVILGGAFLIDPAVGIATAVGLALHQVPQEIVEFGVLVRAGYSRVRAAVYNFISASSIILGTLLVLVLSEHAADYVWLVTGLAAGNLLYIAASDLLPRIHGNLKNYGNIWYSTLSIMLGFALMTAVLTITHAQMEYGHEHDLHVDEHHDDEDHDEDSI